MVHKTLFIAIAGSGASGKSVMAKSIVSGISSDKVAMISEDAYYKDQKHLEFEERVKTNYDHPDAFDHDLMIEHLGQLQQGHAIELPIYDYVSHTRTDQTQTIANHAIVIIEGILVLHEPALRKFYDISLFMDTPPDLCLSWRIKRDMLSRGRTVDSVLTQYEATVRPMFEQFIEPSKQYADIIIPNGGENRIAMDMVQAKIRELLTDV